MFDYDVIVVGGGHAGVEASNAASKMGMKTCLITLNKTMIANMPCNPSIGGSAKGIVVREIDALGGLMGIAADHDYLQIKMLNEGKGPGVRCLRAQEDKRDYPEYVQYLLSQIDNLDIVEAMVTDLIYHDNIVEGVILSDGRKLTSKAVILSTGTYMESRVLRGEECYLEGPDGEKSSLGLSPSLNKMGINLFRLKTGTPPRIKKSSIDFSKTVRQDGQEGNLAFSYETTKFKKVSEQLPCYLTYTNEETHNILRSNLHRSAQFSGTIKGIGPRYCPSIEGKITMFQEKKRHQLFLEPERRNGESIYLQGLSSSMPRDVQEKVVHSIAGLEHAEFLKYAYAIEYDSLLPSEYDATLRVKKYKGLYGAGQICGTSGYEEAGGLGLVAGVNAALYIKGEKPFILKRNESYIGVMIDDLVTKGTDEPYRLLSSRAEYRLLLRHDNADFRLTPIAYKLGLISEERYKKFEKKNAAIKKAIEVLKTHRLGSSKKVNTYLQEHNLTLLSAGVTGYDFLKRPEIHYHDLKELIPELHDIELSPTAIYQLETMIKYEGYIKKEEQEAASFSKYEELKLPQDVNYLELEGLRLEARQKLEKVKPLTIAQANRIPGVNPSDISILIMLLKRKNNDIF